MLHHELVIQKNSLGRGTKSVDVHTFKIYLKKKKTAGRLKVVVFHMRNSVCDHWALLSIAH